MGPSRSSLIREDWRIPLALTLRGNGFVFTDYSSPAFLAEIQKALDLYQNRKKFFALAEKNCSYNFSWEESAKKYVTLYEDVLSKR